MATRGKPISEETFEDQGDWRQINELLRLGQYEQAAKLLYEAQVASQQTGNIAFIDILTAAHQICLACGQCQAEVAWHQKAHAQAVQRELGLKQQLQTMLHMVSSRGPSETLKDHVISPNVPTAEPGLPDERAEPEPEERYSLWQWAQKLLGRKPDPQSIEQKTSAESIETLAMSLAGEIEGPQEIDVSVPFPPLPDIDETKPFADEIKIPTAEEARVSPEEAEVLTSPPTEEVVAPAPTHPEKTEEQAISHRRSGERTTPSDETELPPIAPVIDEKPDQQSSPMLVVYCLGSFRVYQDDRPIQDWKSSKGKALFKYLITHRGAPIAKEVLMDLFWPDSTPEAARNNLNVAIYGLRQTLRQARPDLSHVLFQDDHYLLKSELQIWVDVEAFMEHF